MANAITSDLQRLFIEPGRTQNSKNGNAQAQAAHGNLLITPNATHFKLKRLAGYFLFDLTGSLTIRKQSVTYFLKTEIG